jgi:hypothetical protein
MTKYNVGAYGVCKIALYSTIVAFGIFSCDEDAEKKEEQAPRSSYDLIQEKIFNTSCAISGCHSAITDAAYAQHGLLLTAEYSYKSLINTVPANAQALADGFKRVAPNDLDNSFLLHKIHCEDDHHVHDYGSPMPLGKDPLSQGQIDYITAWISAGAPEDSPAQADSVLLDDNVPACEENFTALAAPAPGEGYQISVAPFEVKPMFEREIFVFKNVGNAEEVFIDRFEMKMRRNSHHFLANTFEASTPLNVLPTTDQVREVRDAQGHTLFPTLVQMEYHVYTIASQSPTLEYSFPPGVALRIPANHKLDMNLHYVNKSQNTILGECYMNLYTADPASVEHEAKPIFLNNLDITLPPNSETTVTKIFATDVPMKIFMLTSHTHKLGEKFEILVSGGPRDGEIIYTSTTWHHPAVTAFDTPVELDPGQALIMRVTYNNTTSRTITFGLTSEDEMGIIYGYYY